MLWTTVDVVKFVAELNMNYVMFLLLVMENMASVETTWSVDVNLRYVK